MNFYLHQSFGWLLALLAGIGLFNLWVDPYSIYRYSSADTDRLSRLDQVYTMRLSKPWQVAVVSPDAVVIGSSRTAPIRPVHASWSSHRGYNLSMPGMSLYEMKRLLEHAHQTQPLDKLVIGVELASFLSDWSGGGLGFAEGRLLSPSGSEQSSHTLQLLRDMGNTLFSLSAVSHSVKALDPANRPAHRFYADGSWENHSAVWLGEPGYIFVGRALVKRAQESPADLAVNYELLKEILDWCHREQIDARLFINPEHLFLVELRKRAGYGEQWTRFHHRLVEINEQVAKDHDRRAFPLQGFNHLESIVGEQLATGVGSLDSWFRDGIHYHRRMGELILDSLWHDAGIDKGKPDYDKYGGRNLNTSSVQAYIREVEKKAADYELANKRVVDRYRSRILTEPALAEAGN